MATTITSPRTTYQDTSNQVRQVLEIADLMSIAETPFLASIGGGTPDSPSLNSLEGGSLYGRYLEWMEDEMRPREFTLGAALADGVVTTLTVTPAAAALHLVKGLVLQLNSGERVRVAVAGVVDGTATIQRSYNGTTAAAQSNGTKAKVITRVNEEGVSVTADPTIDPTPVGNHFQIFKETFGISFADEAVKRYGVTNAKDRATEKAMKQMLIDLETAILLNKAGIAQAAGVSGQLGGVDNFIDSTMILDVSGAALSRDHIDTIMNRQFGAVGQGKVSTDLWIDGEGYKEISELYSGGVMQVWREQADQKAGIVIKQIETVHGLLNVHASPLMPAKTIYLFRTEMLGVGPLDGNEFALHELALKGDVREHMAYGAYTFQMRGRLCHGKIHNFIYS